MFMNNMEEIPDSDPECVTPTNQTLRSSPQSHFILCPKRPREQNRSRSTMPGESPRGRGIITLRRHNLNKLFNMPFCESLQQKLSQCAKPDLSYNTAVDVDLASELLDTTSHLIADELDQFSPTASFLVCDKVKENTSRRPKRVACLSKNQPLTSESDTSVGGDKLSCQSGVDKILFKNKKIRRTEASSKSKQLAQNNHPDEARISLRPKRKQEAKDLTDYSLIKMEDTKKHLGMQPENKITEENIKICAADVEASGLFEKPTRKEKQKSFNITQRKRKGQKNNEQIDFGEEIHQLKIEIEMQTNAAALNTSGCKIEMSQEQTKIENETMNQNTDTQTLNQAKDIELCEKSTRKYAKGSGNKTQRKRKGQKKDEQLDLVEESHQPRMEKSSQANVADLNRDGHTIKKSQKPTKLVEVYPNTKTQTLNQGKESELHEKPTRKDSKSSSKKTQRKRKVQTNDEQVDLVEDTHQPRMEIGAQVKVADLNRNINEKGTSVKQTATQNKEIHRPEVKEEFPVRKRYNTRQANTCKDKPDSVINGKVLNSVHEIKGEPFVKTNNNICVGDKKKRGKNSVSKIQSTNQRKQLVTDMGPKTTKSDTCISPAKRLCFSAKSVDIAKEDVEEDESKPAETKTSQVPSKKGRKARGKQKSTQVKTEAAEVVCNRPEGITKFVGAHCSIAGGVSNAVKEAVSIGAKAFGLFVRNGRTWKLGPLNEAEAQKFRTACKEHGYPPHLILPHGSYLLNCGSSNPDILSKSRDTLVHELQMCESLGLTLYNFHPGSACGDGSVSQCLQTIADSINLAHRKTKFIKTIIENMSCQGKTVGGKFEELKAIIEKVEDKSRVGVCLDTCHAFAAGHDISQPEGYNKMMDEFERVVGLDYLSAIHLNDSKGEVGCHLDRHENIGKGRIGLSGFKCVMNDSRLNNIPMILETPPNNYAAEIKRLYDLEET